jgi:arylsulfatase A-like enzyme
MSPTSCRNRSKRHMRETRDAKRGQPLGARRQVKAFRWLIFVLVGLVISRVALAAATLPQQEPAFKGKMGFTVQESVPDWPKPVTAPAGAPNIVLILLDDVGFAATSTLGGPTQTPVLDRLAAKGLLYNRFHVSAQCAPTRAALLSGRNDHRVGFGDVGEGGYPGYNSIWPRSAASIAEVLKDNGYSTAAFGKWHNTPDWEISPVGPFDRWPTGLGFEYFYGFMAGADSQYEPELYRNTTAIEPPSTLQHGYHFTTDITDEAIAWIQTHESLAPNKPYFLYMAPGATHGPHHVPEKWIQPYRGHFDQGWDSLRAEIFARQKKLRVIPADAVLTSRPKEMPAWTSFPLEERQLLARQMEVYAGFMAQTDYEMGRLLQAVQDSPTGANTLVLYIVGDNGASSEAGLTGVDGLGAESIHDRLEHTKDLGSVRHWNQYAAGWAWALSSPFQWQKLIASHLGGTRNPLIVSWPAKIKLGGEIRDQYTHVTDVAATLYDVAAISFPSVVNGAPQLPLDGVSFAPSFVQKNAPSRHTSQIYEQWGNRAIYHDGWLASARHFTPWVVASFKNDGFDKDQWELYNLDEDFSQAHDLAGRFPEKLQELKGMFNEAAIDNNIYPFFGADQNHAPNPTAGRTVFTYHENLPRTPSAQAPDFSRSHVITADIEVPDGGAAGVIISNGGRYGGFIIYMKDDRLVYEHKISNGTVESITSSVAVHPGAVEVVFGFNAESRSSYMGSSNASGVGKLFIDGKEAGLTHIENLAGSNPFMLASTFNIGQARGSPVSDKFEMPFRFTGVIRQIKVELK